MILGKRLYVREFTIITNDDYAFTDEYELDDRTEQLKVLADYYLETIPMTREAFEDLPSLLAMYERGLRYLQCAVVAGLFQEPMMFEEYIRESAKWMDEVLEVIDPSGSTEWTPMEERP